MPSLYRIYFSWDSTVLSLPINPEKLPETKESDNGEYNRAWPWPCHAAAHAKAA